MAAPAANLVGDWTFENASDLTEATIGSSLALNGTITATTGLDGSDGAADVERTANFTVTNPIGANGAGSPTRTNQFTIVVDFQVPDFTDGGADNGNFTGIFEFSGGGDGDYFIRKQGTTELGVSAVGYTGAADTFVAGTWYRLVYAVDSGGVGRSTYLDGTKIGNNNGNNSLDYTRGSLDTTFGVFEDNTTSEQSRIIVSRIALFDERLSDAEIALLGAAGNSLVLPDPQPLTWTGATSGEWSNDVLGSPKNWVLQSDGTTESDFENLDTVLFDDTASITTIDISNGDVQPNGVTFDSVSNSYTLTGTHGITGSTGMLIDGNADLRIENANSHTGDTDHLAFGDLTLAHENALQNSTLITYSGNGYFFDGITTASLGGLSGSGDIVLENNASSPLALTLGGSNGDASYDGELTGTGSITKIGTGRQTLAFTNAYSGGTTITEGTLLAGDPGAFGSEPVVSTGGILEFEIASGSESVFANDVTLPAVAGITRMFGSFGPGRTAPTPGTATRLTGLVSGGDAGTTFRFGDTGVTLEHDNTTILDNPNNSFVGLIEMWRSVLAFTSDGALGDADNDIEIDSANFNGGIRFGADTTLNANRTVTLIQNEVISSDTFTGAFDGPVSGSGTLRKLGTGTLVLNHAANDYAGGTQVNEGTLQVVGTLTSGGGTVSVAAGASLAGTGTIERDITLDGSLSPGASVGTLASTGTMTLGALSSYAWEISDWIGAAGIGYDTATADSLDITATSANPVTVIVTPDSIANFTDETRAFTLISTTSGITGFAADAFSVDASALPAASGTWSVEVSGNDLQLVHTIGGATPFESWAEDQITDIDPLAPAGFEDDADGDGLANGLEFILDEDPLSGSIANPIEAADDGTDFVITFTLRDDAASLSPVIEFNTDLGASWTTAEDGVNATISATDNGATDEIEVRIPKEGNTSMFARLTVSE